MDWSQVVLSNSEDHPWPNYPTNFYHTFSAFSIPPFLKSAQQASKLEIELMPIQEIASMLIAFDRHHDWMSKEVKIRPKSGSMLLYSRKKVEDCFPPTDWSWPPTNFQVRYRRDGYCWKKRKDGKTTREDHMKLKVQGMEVGDQWPTNQTTSKSTPHPPLPPSKHFL